MTPDCLDPKFDRNRRGGARRFQTLVSTLVDSSTNQLAALESFHTLGVRSVIIVRDASSYGLTFSMHAAKVARDAANQLNIKVLDMIELTHGICPGGSPACPPLPTEMGQNQGQGARAQNSTCEGGE